MSNDAYGNLGNEMKAMKDGRDSLRTEIKDHHRRIRSQTGQTLSDAKKFMGETSKANKHQAAQTRQMLAQSERDLKTKARQALAEADQLASTIRKNVAALKVEAGQILSAATGFMAQTGLDNARLKAQTHKMLTHARAESKAQTRETMAEAGKVISQTRLTVAGIKTQTGRMLTDAAGVMRRLSEVSRQRSSAWRNILHMLHGNHRPQTTAPGAGRAAASPATKRTKANARKPRKVA